MSASSMDLPPVPPGPPGPPDPPDPPSARIVDSGPGAAQALQLTVLLAGRPIAMRVRVQDGELLPDTPMELRARRTPGGWVLEGPHGQIEVRPGDQISLRQGELEVQVAPVRQSRFPRFAREQGDLVLPMIVVTLSVLLMQIALILRIFGTQDGGADGRPEPSPEYIARLLDEQYNGQEQGVIAPAAPRPKTGDKIEGFYLQAGHDGPREHLGGGKNVGDHIADGEKDGKKPKANAAPAPPAPGGGEEESALPPVEVSGQVPDATADAADPEDAQDDEDHPIAVHVDEGWGLSDWYDTQDAREDAKEIEKQLRFARQILKLDPNDPYGLTTRAYYEYLATDYDAAARTYEKFTKLYPQEPAGWNNLALVYKRKGEYVKEEELYRIALSLAPEDDHAMNNLAVCLAHQGRFDEALALMERLEVLTPDDPYADLHRAKIYGAMGKEDRSYRFLQKSLAGMRKLDTLHNIEFRQDIRLDPAFENMRKQDRFRALLDRYYGDQPNAWWKKLGGK